MMEMQAVIGRIQLQRMTEWTEKRTENAEEIFTAFENSPYFTVHRPTDDYLHAQYKCYVQVNINALPSGWSRDRIMQFINAEGVPCYSGSCSEVYLEHAFDNTNWRPEERLKNAQQLGETSLMFLVHPTLSEDNINKTVDVIEKLKKVLDH
jgi:dTDP-4-amino-4,6-dideoxygalactose transaminase